MSSENNTSIVDCEPRGSSIISVAAQHLLIRRGQPLCTSTLFLSNTFSLHNNKSSPNSTPQMMFENRGCARSKNKKMDGFAWSVSSFLVSSMKKVEMVFPFLQVLKIINCCHLHIPNPAQSQVQKITRGIEGSVKKSEKKNPKAL